MKQQLLEARVAELEETLLQMDAVLKMARAQLGAALRPRTAPSTPSDWGGLAKHQDASAVPLSAPLRDYGSE